MITFSARFAGDCRACQGRVRRGDPITRDRRLGYVHANCRATDADDHADAARAFDMRVEDQMAEQCGFSPFGGPDQ